VIRLLEGKNGEERVKGSEEEKRTYTEEKPRKLPAVTCVAI